LQRPAEIDKRNTKARMEGFCCNHTTKKFQYYMRVSKFLATVKSDHRNLRTFTTTKELNAHQARWELCAYNFVIEHIKEKENVVADALSRRQTAEDGYKRFNALNNCAKKKETDNPQISPGYQGMTAW
jgi:reverse transcriptase-like protein